MIGTFYFICGHRISYIKKLSSPDGLFTTRNVVIYTLVESASLMWGAMAEPPFIIMSGLFIELGVPSLRPRLQRHKCQ